MSFPLPGRTTDFHRLDCAHAGRTIKNSPLTGYYYDYLLSGPFFGEELGLYSDFSVLILGLGAGTFAKQCKYFFPHSEITGVEIDQKIIALAKEHFDLTPEEVRIEINDGRTFLQGQAAGKYDLILVDAYHDITIPFHMATKEFYCRVKEHLKTNGVLVLNINMYSEEDSTLINHLTQTVKAVMQKVYFCDLDSNTNSLVFASNNQRCLAAYWENMEKIPTDHELYPILRYVAEHLSEITQADLILTDEVAPVEVMGQKVLDELVQANLAYYRQELESTGSLIELIKRIGNDR